MIIPIVGVVKMKDAEHKKQNWTPQKREEQAQQVQTG